MEITVEEQDRLKWKLWDESEGGGYKLGIAINCPLANALHRQTGNEELAVGAHSFGLLGGDYPDQFLVKRFPLPRVAAHFIMNFRRGELPQTFDIEVPDFLIKKG